jgi:hypothetical protein
MARCMAAEDEGGATPQFPKSEGVQSSWLLIEYKDKVVNRSATCGKSLDGKREVWCGLCCYKGNGAITESNFLIIVDTEKA